MTEIEIQVTGVDMRDPNTVSKIGELSEYMWSTNGDLVTFTVFSESTPIDDSVRALRRLACHMPEARPIRVYEEQVTIPEIANRVVVSREAVRKWVDSPDTSNFPAPVQRYPGRERGDMRVWIWRDVVAWLKNEKAIDLDGDLPDFATVTAVNAHIAGLHHDVESTWMMGRELTWAYRAAIVHTRPKSRGGTRIEGRLPTPVQA